MRNTPIIAAFGITPSPHRRTTAPSSFMAFAHIYGEAGIPSLRTRSAVVGPDGPVLCVKGVDYNMQNDPFSLHSASPRLRTGAPQHLVCFWPSLSSRTIGITIFAHPECGGGYERAIYFCVWKGCISMRKNTPIIVAFGITRLRTGEQQHLVCLWPSPTSMTRREHHLCAPGVRWWVRTVRFCVWKGYISMRNTPIIAAFGITPSLHR
jgi:hypothetical protein